MSTIPQSTTPRTDAAVRLTIGAGFNMVYPSFARELENELAAAIQISVKYENRYFETLAKLTTMTTRAEKAEAEAKQLINAGVNN